MREHLALPELHSEWRRFSPLPDHAVQLAERRRVMTAPIASRPWSELLENYLVLVEEHGVTTAAPMLELTRQIASSRYSKGTIYGTTSMFTLLIAQTPVFESRREMLQIEPKHDRVVFTFFEDPYIVPRWQRTCRPEDAFATLEHFLLVVKKWWVKHPPLKRA